MKTWIAKIKDSGPWIVFFEIFVIAQLLLIFVFNLTHLKYEAGFDSSAAMAQAMEIWNQKSIFFKTLGLPVYTWTRFRDYSREYFLRDYPQHFFSLRHC